MNLCYNNTQEGMIQLEYVPLQIMSSYSLLHSTISIPRLVQFAKQRGYSSLTLTDRNVMYGTVEFYNQCIKNNLRPIIGLTLSLEGVIQTNQHFDIILLAQNNIGYHNLLWLSTESMINNQDALKLDEIKNHLRGLNLITPLDGELISLLKSERLQDAHRYCQTLLTASQASGIYLGVHPQMDQQTIDQIRQMGADLTLSLVALDPVRYLNAEDDFAEHVLLSIDSGEKMVSPLQSSHRVGRQWLKPNDKIVAEFERRQLTDAVKQGNQLGKKCNVEIEKRPIQLPPFQNEMGISSKQYLDILCQKGLKLRLAHHQIDANRLDDYQHRLNRELKLIDQMGFDDYFLIVWDVINYAHRVNIMTGPGRGSAAGSLVAYTLFITDVDPIHYDLLFERFLNPERAQMPDIDLDIPDDQRDVILKYVHDKYGNDRVAQIITFGTFGAKQSLRDVGRVFGMNPQQVNQMSKTVPDDTLHIKLDSAYQRSKALQNIVQDQPINRLIFETATHLEGLPRHFGTHAAGLILSAVPLVEMTPLQNGNENMLMTQYSKNYTEEVGLLKIDFLGLRNLSTLAQIVNLIHQNGDPTFNVQKINLNDPKTLLLFQNGNTNGVFQFESSGIKRILKELHPDSFEMVAAVDALYRPGPMQNIDTFIQRKRGQQPISYLAPELKPILAPTFGIIVYQEQVMQVASVMGGFTLGQADILRRAMSKKKHAVMDSMRIKFIRGALAKGFDQQVAERTFDYIDQFASYGFNKSHAVAYSKMAFELAYLKVHYGMEFYTAILNSVIGNDNKLRNYVQEIKKRHLSIMGPDINQSDREFSIHNQRIYFGLGAIRGLRSDLVTALLDERRQNGVFKDLANLLQRLDVKFRKIKLLQPLIDAGALDGLGYHRSELTASLDDFIEFINLSGNSMELIQMLRPKIHRMDEWDTAELLERERETLGVYLSKYPIEQYNDVRVQMRAIDTSQYVEHPNSLLTLLYIGHIKRIRTKKGDSMAFVSASDENGEIDLVLFPNVYKKVQGWLHAKMVVVVNGKLERNRGEQIVVAQIQPAANLQTKMRRIKPHYCYLRLDQKHNSLTIKRQLYNIIRQHPGRYQILIYQSVNDQKQLLGNQYSLNDDEQTVDQLKTLLGTQNVVYK